MKEVPPLYRWLLDRLNFKAFVVGFIAVLIVLSITGRVVAHHNFYSHFQRFHLFIEAQTLFYPTASQLREIVKSKIQHQKNGKIAVIIGGNSVFIGVGQSEKELWTNKLQKLLGKKYKVVNLAFRGGGIQESGAIAAQALIKEGYKKLIYIANTSPGNIGNPEGWSVYNYFYWDALDKGLLKPYPARAKYIREHPYGPTTEDLKLRMWLDSLFYANDLWTTIGYRWVFTVWNAILINDLPHSTWYQWLVPRRLYPDIDFSQPVPLKARYPASEEKRVIELIDNYCHPMFQLEDGLWTPKTDFWDDFNQKVVVTLPDNLKRRSLIVVMDISPHYVKQLDSLKERCWNRNANTTVRTFRRHGYHSTKAGFNFAPEDYLDHVHLVSSGGEKLAAHLAPQIRAIAQELGYVKSNQKEPKT